MLKNQKLNIKVGDIIKVISGSDRNKTGKILKIYYKTGKILVKGVNFKFKHLKPNNDNEVGEIKQFEAPIHHSNVKLIKSNIYSKKHLVF
jgi:large subunit ribosomal protein L24